MTTIYDLYKGSTVMACSGHLIWIKHHAIPFHDGYNREKPFVLPRHVREV